MAFRHRFPVTHRFPGRHHQQRAQPLAAVQHGVTHGFDQFGGCAMVHTGGRVCGHPAFECAFDAVKMLSLIHISEPTRLGMISYAVFCLKKKKKIKNKKKKKKNKKTKKTQKTNNTART